MSTRAAHQPRRPAVPSPVGRVPRPAGRTPDLSAPEPLFGRDFSRVRVQPLLRVSDSADPDEREAETVAARVVSGSAAGRVAGTATAAATTLHRLAADRDPSLDDIEIDEEGGGAGGGTAGAAGGGTVQTLRAPTASRPVAALDQRVFGIAMGGRPLDAAARGVMQERFGVDFGGVRIHDDRRAADLAESIGARAFTYGADIFFGSGEYRPGSSEGTRVLAHELTHVVQQRATAGPRSPERHRVARLGAPGPAVKHNVKPWGGDGPSGSNHEAPTDGGSTVSVWIAYPVWNEANSYWCHGHSLGTYTRYGYSVYSGPPMATAVRDEWTNISPEKTRAGDIAVWTSNHDHSATFTAPAVKNGTLDPDASMLSTKNGRNPLRTMSLSAIIGVYGPAGVAVFRRK
jgi:Domain of unknown function (DUF4157)